jgi:glycerol-3-phosphate O-acyltransferase
MPKGYEKMRDSIKANLKAKGISEEKADKEAKKIAAATWNKHHPDNPVTNKPHKKKK